MPQPNWVQQGSFEAGAIPPAVAPDAGTPVCIGPVAEEWLPYVQGALDQLKNPSSWIVASDAAMYTVLQRVDELRSIIGMATGCCDIAIRLTPGCALQYSIDGGATWTDVTGWAANFAGCVQQGIIGLPPLLPPGSGVNQRACNIASYLASDVIHVAITQAINAYNNNLSLLALAGNIAALTFAFDLPWTAAGIYAVYDLYAFFTAGNIAALRAAEADAAFWSAVTCAIYGAIKTDGAVTPANCGAVIGAICGIAYGDGTAVAAVCAYVTQLGCNGLLALQIAGALVAGDCSGCGTFCYYFDFTLNNQGWVAEAGLAGTWLPAGGQGPGWYQNVNGAHRTLQFSRHMPGGAHVTKVEAMIFDGDAQFGGAGNRSVYNQNPCNAVTLSEVDSTVVGAIPAGAVVTFTPLVGNADCVKLYWNSQNLTLQSGVIK